MWKSNLGRPTPSMRCCLRNLAHWLIFTQVVTADPDDGDDVDDDTELLSRLGLNDLDDRASRRHRLKRFIEPQKERAPSQSGADVDLGAEFARQGVATDSRWRFTDANSSYDLCATYPPLLIVPAALSDARLKEGSRWRSKRRVPVLTWYCLLYTSPSPRDQRGSRMPSSA